MQSPAKTRSCRRWVCRIARQLEHCFALIGLIAVLYLSCFQFSRITSESMEPTLIGTNWEEGDRILSEKVSYYFRQPKRWEIVTFRHEDGDILVKRVIGLPGEQVQMLRKGRILIDGKEVRRPDNLHHLVYFPFGNLVADQPVDCGSGYFVLGDYSKDSDDSRFNGPIKPKALLGCAWCVYYPPERRTFLSH